MAFTSYGDDFSDMTVADSTTANQLAILDRNWQTTAAVAAGVATGGVTTAVMLAAFPAQTLAAGATIGGLAYTGHRRHKGLDPLPFMGKKDDKSESLYPEPPASEEAAPAAA